MTTEVMDCLKRVDLASKILFTHRINNTVMENGTYKIINWIRSRSKSEESKKQKVHEQIVI